MGINMNERIDDNNSSILQIKELKEKVRSLVSEVDLHRESIKFKHDNVLDSNLNNSVSSEEDEEEFIDCSELELLGETNWLTGEKTNGESAQDICQNVYKDIDDDRPDITTLCQELESFSIREPNIFSSQKASIDSRTFTRPKKFSTRPPLTSVINSGDDGRPKLQRRLTTTISPTPNLISKLEELSKTNNRPVSGNYSELNWQDGSAEGLAEVKKAPIRPHRQSLPASLYDRLQELKKANSSYKMPKVIEPNPPPNGKVQDLRRSAILEDAKKVTAALDIDLRGGNSSSRLSEIFRNTQDYYSDDNESFISLDEVSGFCDRLTLSTDQSTYSSIVKEMEQHEICLFHRTFNEDQTKDRRLTFGGMEIPSGDFQINKTIDQTQLIEEETDLNQTYEIDENPTNGTFEIKKNDKQNVLNGTYDASRKPGLMDVILQSDVIKNLSPKKGNINNINHNNNNNNNNNNRILTTCEGNNILNCTYEKINGTLDQNELNALHSEKYSTKVFDSSYTKTTTRSQRSPTRRSNGKKDSDYSEDDCMSTTSDNSCRSNESNEAKTIEDFRNVAIQQSKKFSSTPITEAKSKLNFEVVSPIRMEMGDGEPQTYSNPSSRGESPRRSAIGHQEGLQKLRMPNIRQPLKVPQRELKLKPSLVRPTQNFKRPLSYARTSSEPSVPQKVESCQPAASVPVLRPTGPTGVPSLTNIKPPSRSSGIPRPPTRLKQPQIRVNYSKK